MTRTDAIIVAINYSLPSLLNTLDIMPTKYGFSGSYSITCERTKFDPYASSKGPIWIGEFDQREPIDETTLIDGVRVSIRRLYREKGTGYQQYYVVSVVLTESLIQDTSFDAVSYIIGKTEEEFSNFISKAISNTIPSNKENK